MGRVEAEIKRRNVDLRQLNGGRCLEERVAAEKAKAAKQQKALQKEIKEETRLAKKAQTKTELIRRELEGERVYDEDSLLSLWQAEYREVAQKLVELEADNERLRSRDSDQEAGDADQLSRSLPPRLPPVQGSGFEEQLCYSIGITTNPGLPQSRRQIDSMHGGRALTLLEQFPTSASEPLRPSNRASSMNERLEASRLLTTAGQDLMRFTAEPSASVEHAPPAEYVVSLQPSASGNEAASTDHTSRHYVPHSQVDQRLLGAPQHRNIPISGNTNLVPVTPSRIGRGASPRPPRA